MVSRMALLCLCGILWGSEVAFAAEECYRQEINPITRKPYTDKVKWQDDGRDLRRSFPAMPGLFDLHKGYQVGVRESRIASGLRGDKIKHCYVGCRISNETSFEVAVYAAFFKEERDLQDCNPRTHFDLKDIDATVAGADLARRFPGEGTGGFCRTQCRAIRP